MGLTLSGAIHSRRRYVLHSEVIRHLCCPVCRRGLAQATADAPVRCPSGHSFDPARQGYVQLTAAPLTHPGDSAATNIENSPMTRSVRSAIAPSPEAVTTERTRRRAVNATVVTQEGQR